MRVSAKGRYALAAVIHMAQNYAAGEPITVIRISEYLGISKIYLEQVFSLLKRSKIVTSAKGSQGGYQLARMPGQITVLDVLSAVELALFEKAEDTVPEKAPAIEAAIRSSAFDILDHAIKTALEKVTLEDLVAEAERYQSDSAPMFYI